MKRQLLLVSLALAVTSCRTPYPNVSRFPVNHARCKAMVVVHQDFHDLIGYVDGDGDLTFITADLDTLGEIKNVLPSPGRQRVLIESSGEGDPFVSIYDVDALLDHHEDSQRIPAVGTLDPYPYGFTKLKWVDDNTVQFESVADFHAFDKELRRGKYSPAGDDEVSRRWRWCIPADTFEEIRWQPVENLTKAARVEPRPPRISR